MTLSGALLDGVIENAIASLLVVALVSLAGYVYRAKILAWLQQAFAWSTNSEVQAHITRIDKFGNPPTRDIDLDLFSQIQEEYPDVQNAGLSENTLRIRANNIPSVLEIRIEEEHDFNDKQPDVVGYKLAIETYSDLRFGYRTYDSLERFEAMSETIAYLVQTHCFTGEHPHQSFILSELKEGIPQGVENIEDDELDISAQIRDSTMQMTIRSPQNLTKGIRRYYHPA